MTANRNALLLAPTLLVMALGLSITNIGMAAPMGTGEFAVRGALAGPGTDGTAILCSDGAPVQLIDFLGGMPQPGGTWSGPAAHPGTFDPATDVPGVFTYTVPGSPVTIANVTVIVHALPDAGSNGALTVCSNDPGVDLLTVLGGSPDATGSWTLNGDPVGAMFTPGTSPAGAYLYTVSGTAPCPNASATVTVTVDALPNAGSNGTLTVCNNDGPVDLFTRLGGNPDTGGSWTFNGASANATFTPGTSQPGVYTYTVAGTPPCPNAAATVTVTVNRLPVAGSNGSLTVCSNDDPLDLFTLLGGTPDAGGVWTFNGDPVGDTFTPGSSAPGLYTYTVSGTPPCPNATASVTMAVVQAPDAGEDRSITVCSDDAPFNMLTQLGGTPDAGGTWSPGGSATFTPGTSTPGVYTYLMAGTTPCANESAKLTVTVRQAPNAGTNRPVAVCSDDAVFSLVDSLGGTPDGGGTWTGPNGPHSGQFQPGTDPAGAYVYHVTGQAPCSPATATVTVTVSPAPDAGASASVAKCSNDPAFTLISQLGGTPDAGGSWTGPGGAPFPSGTFTPGTSAPGLYTYTVLGQAPCNPAVSTVNVAVTTAPDAGGNATYAVCSSDGEFDLIDHLAGTPDGGGTWTGPDGPVTNGRFRPGNSTPGNYVYLVAGTGPCADAAATLTVNVVTAANAGSNGSVTLCSTDDAEDLFPHLGGTPDTGGTWTKPTPPGGTLAGGLYEPSNASHPAGNYTYTVSGTTPCPNVSTTVQVVENQAPNAGVDAVTTQCSTNPQFNMRSILGGGPDAGGTWLNASGVIVPATFTPGTTAPGVYRYVVNGLSPCANDTSQVTVNVNIAPDAGNNGAITVCSDDDPVDLFLQLGGNPDTGGTWTNPNNASNNGAFVPGPTAVPGGYTYRVAGLSPCADATSVVTVTQHRRPVAGTNATVDLCSTDAPVNLFDHLGGTPDAGGTWTGPGNTNSNGIFIPGSAGTYIYEYKVTGTAPCAPDQATVTVHVTQAPYAGENGTITICTGQPVVDLFDGLGGTPDLNGTWSEITVTGRLSSHFFNAGTPTQMPAGNYDFRYVVPANASCAGDTATVRVTIVSLLNAGHNGSKFVCNTETQVNLFTALGGSPQPGGTWIDLDATGQVTGQYFNAQGAGPGTYHFRYKLTGALGCDSDSAMATINVVQGPNAGHESWATFCSEGPPVNLFPYVSPAHGGGVWRKPAPGNEIFSGTYDPATFDPGDYTYTVSGTPPCAAAVAVVHVSETAAPNGGSPEHVKVCANDPSFNMTAALGGTPDTTGTWRDPEGNAHSKIFVPGQDASGVYQYTVPGTFPCVDKITTLTVSVSAISNAGGDHSHSVCDNEPSFQLLDLLPMGTESTGQWFDPDMNELPTGSFVPGVSQPGTYTYKVAGQTPCDTATGTVTVFVTTHPTAGTNASISLCEGGSSVDLVTVLTDGPDLNGTWTGPAPTQGYFSGTFTPGIDLAGMYTYHVNAIPPCAADSSTVTVTVKAPPYAGQSRTINVCSSDGLFAMIGRLGGGTPDFNGTWTAQPSGLPSDGIFDPNVPAGTYKYRYTVTPVGVSPCSPVYAELTINVTRAPWAGENGVLDLCSTGGSTAMFPALGGNPQTGGTWSYNGTDHGSSFDPGNDVPGNYAYTVHGTGGCANDVALVTVNVHQYPNAGSNGVLILCDDTVAAILLRDVLNGVPDQGGTWRDQNGNPVSEFYIPGNSPGVNTFTYTVPGQAPCPATVSAQATIIEYEHAYAGENPPPMVVCSNVGDIHLPTVLGPTAQSGGTWYNANNVVVSSTFTPTHLDSIYVFRYVVTGDAPCVNDTARVTITVNRRPNAGASTAPQLCEGGPIVLLYDLLGGNADITGSWAYHPVVGVPVPHGPIFNPATDPAGKYVYTVPGAAPCSSISASVQITLVPPVDAGVFTIMSACVDDDAVNLCTGLQGTPQSGGVWTDLDGTGHLTGCVFDATGVAPGTYHFLYSLPSNGACPGDTASVAVTVTPELNAGLDATATFCVNEVPFLTDYLGGGPQPGGTWTAMDGPAGLSNGWLVCAAAGVGEHQYRYVVSSSANCAPDTAFLNVTILNGPRAGHGQGEDMCTSDGPLDLFNKLSPPYDMDGQWYAPDGSVLASSVINPAVNQPGTYYYVVSTIGNCPADTAFVPITIIQAGNAGTDGPLSFCSNGAPGVLSGGLGGTPDTNGSWAFHNPLAPPVPHGTVFNPLIDPAGIYVYTVPGSGPCPSVSAQVIVSKVQAPVAGLDNTHTLCSSDGPFNMFTRLAGNPQTGGTWRRDGNIPTTHGSFYDPAVDSSGVFLYVLLGNAPCANDTARLTVIEVPAPNAGTDVVLNACHTDTLVDLFEALGPDVDDTGTWTDADGQEVTDTEFNPSQVPSGAYLFTYTVAAPAPCDTARATVTVNVGAGLDPGIGGNDTICGSNQAYDLFQSLGGTPDLGGIWSEETGMGAIDGHHLNARLLAPESAYPMVYTVSDPGCGQAQSVVSLYIAPYPDPGMDTTVVLCATGDPVDLNTLLRNADPGGLWLAATGEVMAEPIFDPATGVPGNHRYYLPGTAFCGDTLALIKILVNAPPNAGTDGQLQACNSGQEALFPLLGNADVGGTWTNLGDPGQVFTGVVDLDSMAVGLHRYGYRVDVTGCPSDSSQVLLTVVDGVVVDEPELICDEQYRTYVVRFTITGGDPASYLVTGADGVISEGPPYIFTSAPFFTSQTFALVVDDANQCAPVTMEGETPCDFADRVQMPESFSPNGDGYNDQFIIPGIEGYPRNSIIIINRWGGTVYSAQGYDNRSVVWDGSSPDALIPGDASTGTYYYILDLGDGGEAIKGFIYLNR